MDATMLARRLRAGETLIGLWLTIPEPMVIEAMGRSGHDFLQVDGEHGPISPDVLAPLLASSTVSGLPTVYRARRNCYEQITAPLDAGCAGTIVPMVLSATEAANAVAAATYPPRGRRGFGPWRASNWYRNLDEYLDVAEESRITGVLIEHVTAIAAIDEIAATPGLDLLFVGPGDLAMSMGLRPGTVDPRISEAMRTVAEAGKRHGVAVGTDVASPAMARQLRDLGYRYFTSGSDIAFLSGGASALGAALRDALTH